MFIEPVRVQARGTTVKQLQDAVPATVEILRDRGPVDASEAMLIETGRVLRVPPLRNVAVMPSPTNVTDETPARLIPPIVASNVVPGIPNDGVIAVIVGCVG